MVAHRTLDLRKFRAVEPGVLYPVAAVAGLFGKSEDALRQWWKARGLPWVVDPSDCRRRLISGDAILETLGGLLLASSPAPTETARQRAERHRKARDERKRLAKGRTP